MLCWKEEPVRLWFSQAELVMTQKMDLIKQLIDFLVIMLTLITMEKNPARKKNEQPIIVLLLFILFFVPVSLLFGGRPNTKYAGIVL